jgi:hypothetical protein
MPDFASRMAFQLSSVPLSLTSIHRYRAPYQAETAFRRVGVPEIAHVLAGRVADRAVRRDNSLPS